ncbi:phage tail tape measure protein [Pantoea piersonii]|uniref:phage tail tape measure protein n=1 Tax=Pantoea piersonii TaxID=2364647 RepID=UPI0022F165DD|nr:phage tail tape measure protein [Pantoea piersonii]WBV22106.1 phage tail tape measure protein [Pantoea piersonii]
MSDTNLRLQVVLSAVDKITRPFRNARDGSKELAAALKASKDDLKSLNEQAGRIDGFRKTRSQLAITEKNLAGARQEAAALAQQFAATNRPTAQQARLLEQAKSRASQLQETYNGLRLSVQRQREALSAAGIDTKQLSAAQRSLRNDAQAATGAIERQQAELRKLGERQQKLAAIRARHEKLNETRNKLAGNGAGMVATGVTTGVTLMAPVRAYSDSENAATQLAASMMGPGAKVLPEYEQINRLAVSLGDKLPGTTADFQNMMTMLRRQGMSAQSILGGLGEATAYLGVQLKMAPTDAAEFAAKLQDATQTSERDMMRLTDIIQKGFYAGVDPGNMLQGFAKISSAMNIIKMQGIDAAKVFAPLLVMADQSSMAGESAGNAYRKVFQSMMNSENIRGVNDDLKGTGVKFDFTDGKGEFGGIEKMYKQLAQIGRLNTEKKLSTIKDLFGDDAEVSQVIQIMISKGVDGYRDAAKKLETQASLRERVDASLKTLANRWDAAGGSFTNALAAIGATVAPDLKRLVDWLGDLASALGNFVQQHPQITAALFRMAAGFAIAVTAVGALSLTAAAILGPLALLRLSCSVLGIKALPGIATAASRAGSMLGWLGSAPLNLLRRGMRDSGGRVSLLAGPLASLRASAGMAGNALKAVAGAPLRLFRGAMRGVSAAAGMIMNPVATGRALLSGAGKVLRWLASGPVAVLRVALTGISWAIGALLSPVGLLVAALAGVALVVWKYWQPIKAFLGGVVEGFRAAAAPISEAFGPLKPVFQWVGDKVQALFGWFRDLLTPVQSTGAELDSAAAKGKAFGQALADGLSMVMHPLDTLKSGVSWLLEKLGIVTQEAAKAKLPERVTRQQAATVDAAGKVVLPPGGFPRMYDTGGNIPSGQTGIVGENGPELINGPVNVTSRRRTARLAAMAAMALGSAAAPATAAPLHPMSLPAPSRGVIASGINPAGQPPIVMHGKYDIHLVQQPGQSNSDLLDELMRRLEAKERQAQARARSTYRDRGGFDE